MILVIPIRHDRQWSKKVKKRFLIMGRVITDWLSALFVLEYKVTELLRSYWR